MSVSNQNPFYKKNVLFQGTPCYCFSNSDYVYSYTLWNISGKIPLFPIIYRWIYRLSLDINLILKYFEIKQYQGFRSGINKKRIEIEKVDFRSIPQPEFIAEDQENMHLIMIGASWKFSLEMKFHSYRKILVSTSGKSYEQKYNFDPNPYHPFWEVQKEYCKSKNSIKMTHLGLTVASFYDTSVPREPNMLKTAERSMFITHWSDQFEPHYNSTWN